jgi:hypothetical protein
MGWLDVDAMLDHMTPQQWAEWQAKDSVEPIGHRGTHEILAILGAIVAGLGGAKDITPESLLHWRQVPEAKPVNHEVAAMALQMIGARRNG